MFIRNVTNRIFELGSNFNITIPTNRIIYEYLVLSSLFSVKSGQRDQLRHSKLATPFISKVYLLKCKYYQIIGENTEIGVALSKILFKVKQTAPKFLTEFDIREQ